MKDFLKYVLATLVGMVLIGVVGGLLWVVMMVAVLSEGSGAVKVEDNSVLVIRLDGPIEDRTKKDPLAFLRGEDGLPQGLDQLLPAIREAKTNDKVKGLYLEAGALQASAAALQELHAALVDFKASGKPIIAYGDNYTQGVYYLCCLADSLAINPEGAIDWHGLATFGLYFKDALDKLGVEAQIFKVGTYKSAVEPFTLNAMSEADRAQRSTYVNETWAQIRDAVAEARGLTPEKMDALADAYIGMWPATRYREEGLVDTLAYTDAVPDLIAHTLGLTEDEDYEVITPAELATSLAEQPRPIDGECIAVYYATGSIVDEAPTHNIGATDYIAGDEMADDLRALADDEDIKAVVIRVNSPGGSAYASEQIAHAVGQLREKKPVVVSMGGYAASGGYYISALADWIVAEPTTLTGSIGIFGLLPVGQELLEEKLGIHVSTVKTNALSDAGAGLGMGAGLPLLFRPLDEQAGALLQAHIERGYDLFTRRCAEGRGIPQDSVKAIGEGRVWTGEHALALGLVDQLGGLDVAVRVAKERAGLEEETIVLPYPEQPSLWEQLLNMAEDAGDSYAEARLRQQLGALYEVYATLEQLRGTCGIQARMPYLLYFNL